MNIKHLATISAIAFSVCAFGANPPGFTDDYDAALKRAVAEKKTVLAVFSGSDWCFWCKMLESQFLSKKEFTDAVTNDLVCLFVDSPRDNSVLSAKAREQNPKLVKKYGITTYPSIMFLDSKGGKIADAKPMMTTPGEWGKYLVAEAKKNAPAEKPAPAEKKVAGGPVVPANKPAPAEKKAAGGVAAPAKNPVPAEKKAVVR